MRSGIRISPRPRGPTVTSLDEAVAVEVEEESGTVAAADGAADGAEDGAEVGVGSKAVA